MFEASGTALEERPHTVVAFLNMHEGLACHIEDLQNQIDAGSSNASHLQQIVLKHTETYKNILGFLPNERHNIKERMMQIIDPQPNVVVTVTA